MTDKTAREQIELLGLRMEGVREYQDRRIQGLDRKIADQQTVINLLMGFLGIETNMVPEVPPVPAVPAYVEVRKVQKQGKPAAK